jgi:hypothetical protein
MAKVLSYICPFCGTEVSVGKNCADCAKKIKKSKPKEKSWEQSKSADGLDLPSDDFDYDDFIAREFGKAPHKKTGLKWYWWALAVVLLIGMIYGVLRF